MRQTSVLALTVALVGLAPAALQAPAAVAAPPLVVKQPVAVGSGGAVASVDADASAAGLAVLRAGGNAVDAAIATAAALGVTEPYSSGVGGGGFFVVYDAATKRVRTIDGRETAPAAMRADAFLEGGRPIPSAAAITSGLSVGVPGTPRLWQTALEQFGTRSLAQVLQPATRLAEEGFVADQTYSNQTAANAARFADFTSSRDYFLTPLGTAPLPGTVIKNPDLARTYRLLARDGVEAFYRGPLARAIVATAQRPPLVPGSTRQARPGLITATDLAGYTSPLRAPTRVTYRGLDVWGMPPPSSGGSTVGEALNILEGYDLRRLSRAQALHLYLEASRLAFADRGRYLGDPGYTAVPLAELLSDRYAADRRACINPSAVAATATVTAGVPNGSYDGRCGPAAPPYDAASEGLSTTHLTTADRFGNVVAYTLTIEQTGGSGIAVPGYGFLLNNELTDFDLGPAPSANSPAPGKRPRSSIAPTIVTSRGRPVLAVGSPGGASIITTVLQVLVERLDLGQSLPSAVAAPRASQRNGASEAEPEFLRTRAPALVPYGQAFTSTAEIGAATAIEVLGSGRMLAAAEPLRRGGGSALVLRPDRLRLPRAR